MPMPSHQSTFEKQREKDVQNKSLTAPGGPTSGSPQPSPSSMDLQPMGLVVPRPDQRLVQEQDFLSEILRMPPNMVSVLKRELGMDGKEITAMTYDEKRRLLEAHRRISARYISPQRRDNPPSSNGALAASSPLQILGNPSSSDGGSAPPSTTPGMSPALFTPDFIQSVANSLDEFDPSFLRPDGEIRFERDFGQWFDHPGDVGGALSLR